MNKNMKGAIAVGAATVLLLGGGGTLAVWNDVANLTGGAISSGQLFLDGTADGAAGTWYHFETAAANPDGTDCAWYATDGDDLAAGYTLVPGDDVILCIDGLTVTAEGGDLYFTASTGAGTVIVKDSGGSVVTPAGVTTDSGISAVDSGTITSSVTTAAGQYVGVPTGTRVYHVEAANGVVTAAAISAYVRVALDSTIGGLDVQDHTFELSPTGSVELEQVLQP